MEVDSLKQIKQEIEIADLNVRYYDDHIKLFQDLKDKSKSYVRIIPDFDYDSTIIDDTLQRLRAFERLRTLLYKKFAIEDKSE